MVTVVQALVQIEKKRADSPRSPPVVPPIPEDEEEELLDFVCARCCHNGLITMAITITINVDNDDNDNDVEEELLSVSAVPSFKRAFSQL